MIPAAIPGADLVGVQPKDWDDSKGRVGNLPFRRVEIDGILFIETAWTPTPAEIADINNGGTVILRYSAPHILITSVGTTTPPPELSGMASISTASPLAHQVIIWDEDADAPTQLQCIEVNAAEGWAIVYEQDGDGNPIVDRGGELRKAKVNGNFSIRWAAGYGPGPAKPGLPRL